MKDHEPYTVACLKRLERYDFLGIAELAEVLCRSKQAISMQRARGKLPKPHKVLKMSPIWTQAQIRRYILENYNGEG